MKYAILPEFPYHIIYEDGRIFSIKSGRFLKDRRHGRPGENYRVVDVAGKPYLLHRLLATAFIPNPENKPEVDHINRDSGDNRLENLQWLTRAEHAAKDKRGAAYRKTRAHYLAAERKTDKKEYCIENKEKEIVLRGRRKYLQEHSGLANSSIHNLVSGKKRSIKGWTLL